MQQTQSTAPKRSSIEAFLALAEPHAARAYMTGESGKFIGTGMGYMVKIGDTEIHRVMAEEEQTLATLKSSFDVWEKVFHKLNLKLAGHAFGVEN